MRRGVLELVTSIEACMLSWLEGGVLEHPKHPPCIRPCIENFVKAIRRQFLYATSTNTQD